MCRLRQADEPIAGMDDPEALQLCGSLESLLGALVGQPSKAEITAALRSLLEHGDVVRMRLNPECCYHHTSHPRCWPENEVQEERGQHMRHLLLLSAALIVPKSVADVHLQFSFWTQSCSCTEDFGWSFMQAP